MTNPPIPIGLMAIVKVLDVNFLSFRSIGTKEWPRGKLQYQHEERMMAWRPTELHEFWRRMLGEDEGKT